jgi:hypothetical protein
LSALAIIVNHGPNGFWRARLCQRSNDSQRFSKVVGLAVAVRARKGVFYGIPTLYIEHSFFPVKWTELGDTVSWKCLRNQGLTKAEAESVSVPTKIVVEILAPPADGNPHLGVVNIAPNRIWVARTRKSPANGLLHGIALSIRGLVSGPCHRPGTPRRCYSR